MILKLQPLEIFAGRRTFHEITKRDAISKKPVWSGSLDNELLPPAAMLGREAGDYLAVVAGVLAERNLLF